MATLQGFWNKMIRYLQLWQYRLWSFQKGNTKLERFLPKNQPFWVLDLWWADTNSNELTKSAKIWLSKSIFYSVDRQWRLESIHTLNKRVWIDSNLRVWIDSIQGYGSTQNVIDSPHCTNDLSQNQRLSENKWLFLPQKENIFHSGTFSVRKNTKLSQWVSQF